MRKKVISIIFLLILSLSALSMAIHLISADSTTPVLSVVPTGDPGATSTTDIPAVAVGSTFSVDIRVNNIGSISPGINGLSYTLTYNSAVLNVTSYHTKQTSFWGSTAASDLTSIVVQKPAGTFTESSIIVPSGAPDESTNTPGVATQITFTVLSTGSSNITFSPSDVGVAYLTYPDSLGNSHDVVTTTENAIYNLQASPTPSPTPIPTSSPTPTPTPSQTPNPALTTTTTGITFSPNPANANTSITFTATVTGSSPSGTITWFTNSTTGTFTPSTNQTSLTAGTSSITYLDLQKGNITVTANYSGDSNNNPSSNTINVTIYPVDDFLHNNEVNFKDVVFFVVAYINYNQYGIYNPACDLNHDGKINFNDLVLFVEAYSA